MPVLRSCRQVAGRNAWPHKWRILPDGQPADGRNTDPADQVELLWQSGLHVAMGAYRALCARCAKSWLFSTTGSSVSSED